LTFLVAAGLLDLQLLERVLPLTNNVISMSPSKAPEKQEEKPFIPKMAGIAPLPIYAARDFLAAWERFHLASFMPSDMTPQERRRAECDREHYGDLLAVDIEEISQHEVDTFILKVTGHARFWLASWEYQKMVREFNEKNRQDDQDFHEQLHASYIEAISNISLL
jgi:hypothetical protein